MRQKTGTVVTPLLSPSSPPSIPAANSTKQKKTVKNNGNINTVYITRFVLEISEIPIQKVPFLWEKRDFWRKRSLLYTSSSSLFEFGNKREEKEV